MTLKERADKAVELKLSGGYNCSQAVTAVLADQTDLTDDQLKHLTAGFCVGMGNMEASCGALIGAVIAAGMKRQGQGTVRYARQISEQFKTRCGATLCKELKRHESGAPLCLCDDCVRNAVFIFGDVIGTE